MVNEAFLKSCYELYKKDWCLARGVKVEDVDEEVGINGGECFVSLSEFATNEFQDEWYMKHLLDSAVFERWQQIIKTVPELGEVGIKVYFDGVHMDTVWVPEKERDATINFIAKHGFDDYNADVKEDWVKLNGSERKPALSFEMVRMDNVKDVVDKAQAYFKYRVVLTCFDPGEEPYADCNEKFWDDKQDAYELAKNMAKEECADLNGEDSGIVPDVGCFEVDDCANNDFEVRWYEKRPEERADGDCDIEYVTTYNVYPIEFTGSDVSSCKYRGFDIQQMDGGLKIYHNGTRLGGTVNILGAALNRVDDICLECAKDKTCALEAVHKVPLDVVIKFADQQQKDQRVALLDERNIEDCR